MAGARAVGVSRVRSRQGREGGARQGALSPPRLGLLLALATFLVDQASKYWFVHVFDLGARGSIGLLPFLDLVLAWNKGVSYSLFRTDEAWGRALLIGVAALAIVAIGFWLRGARDRWTAVALGLLAGGAAGNALDRLHYGAVADFLHFHTPVPLGPLSNYVFNVADVGIVLGVAALLYESLTSRRPAADAPPAA